jgi:hypothetical protein
MKFLATVLGHAQFGTDRAGLIAANAAKDAAVKALEDARENLARYQAVDDHDNDLARIAADAAREATASRQRWVANGCLENARSHHAAGEAANKATSAAQLAAADAAAARRVLPTAEAAVRSAESDLERCEGRINEAVELILLAQFSPTLERFKSVSRERHELHIELRGFMEAAVSTPVLRKIREVLEECAVKPIADFWSTPQGTHVSSPPDEVLERAREWRKEAAKLRADLPDAK